MGNPQVTHLCIVRHGESEWNLEKRIQGQLNPSLTPLGQNQAQAVAARLAGEPWDEIYCSDLARAKSTAEAIAARIGLDITYLPELRERHQGRLEGLLATDAKRKYPDFDAPDVGRETLGQLYERTQKAFAEIVRLAGGRRVVVVCHGGVIRQYLLYLESEGLAECATEVENTSVTRVEWSIGGPKLLAVNDVAHLTASGLLRPA